MAKLYLWLLLLFIPLRGYASLTEVVIYGDDNYPPYSYLENGVAKGIYTEVLTQIFDLMPKYRIKVVLVPWKRGLKLMEQNRAFALFPPYLYLNKRHYIDPYSLPILSEEVVVYCNTETVKSRSLHQWPNDFKGLTVGVNDSFALGGERFWQLVDANEITLRQEKGNEHAILSLYKGRSDCYINDHISILWELKKLTEEGTISATLPFSFAITVSSEQGYLAFNRDNENQFPYKEEFVEAFNHVLKRLKSNGAIEIIINKYTKDHSATK